MLHLLAAHEIALEDKAVGIRSLADDSLEVAEWKGCWGARKDYVDRIERK